MTRRAAASCCPLKALRLHLRLRHGFTKLQMSEGMVEKYCKCLSKLPTLNQSIVRPHAGDSDSLPPKGQSGRHLKNSCLASWPVPRARAHNLGGHPMVSCIYIWEKELILSVDAMLTWRVQLCTRAFTLERAAKGHLKGVQI